MVYLDWAAQYYTDLALELGEPQKGLCKPISNETSVVRILSENMDAETANQECLVCVVVAMLKIIKYFQGK
jgi:hypothetical protein